MSGNNEENDEQQSNYEPAPHIIDLTPDKAQQQSPDRKRPTPSKKEDTSWWREWLKDFLSPMGLFTFVIAGAACLQYGVIKSQHGVMAGQLREMQNGSADTHALAVAAGKQADAAKTQSDNTAVLASAAKDQVAKLEGQIAAMRQQTEISERPWVSAGTLSIKQPLTFDPVKGGSMSISYTLRNTGHSPAFHVMWRSRLMPLSFTSDAGLEIRNARYVMCDPLRKKIRDLFDITVFPGDAIPQGEGIGMSRSEIDTAMVRRNASPFSHAGYISQVLITCVDYQLSFGSKHHQTWYAFMLGVPNANGTYMVVRRMGFPKPESLSFAQQGAQTSVRSQDVRGRT